jgi:type II restriction/modification system DNA methylase subunit YeeA
LSSAGTARQKRVIQRQIDATDRQIDHLVYQLWNLTGKEIAIVEAAMPSKGG